MLDSRRASGRWSATLRRWLACGAAVFPCGCQFGIPATNDSKSEVPPAAEKVVSYSAFPIQGNLIATNGNYDVAIVGNGFFQVEHAGSLYYTRAGSFFRNPDGDIQLGPEEIGMTLHPPMRIPESASSITITGDGQVTFLDDTNTTMVAGQISLYRFPSPERLLEIRPGLYEQTVASGRPYAAAPGTAGFGSLRHRHLESGHQLTSKSSRDFTPGFAGEREFESLPAAR